MSPAACSKPAGSDPDYTLDCDGPENGRPETARPTERRAIRLMEQMRCQVQALPPDGPARSTTKPGLSRSRPPAFRLPASTWVDPTSGWTQRPSRSRSRTHGHATPTCSLDAIVPHQEVEGSDEVMSMSVRVIGRAGEEGVGRRSPRSGCHGWRSNSADSPSPPHAARDLGVRPAGVRRGGDRTKSTLAEVSSRAQSQRGPANGSRRAET
jgi:hypothetical protein